MMRSNLLIIVEHYAASARQDIAAMMADLADDVQWTEMAGFPCAGTYIGKQQIIEGVFKVLGSEWNDYTFTLERLIDGGDSIVGIGDYSASHRQSGKAMKARVVHVWQLSGGKIRKFEQFTDTLLVAQAMSS
ncbi:nuclear transport factor 2 family protein [Iodobacter sp. CM08]|uniref:nuclear transport factor 2 family protein n=1 Tax=Iodobacter sp. CM08 TaxID=3085902 RepID=UPI002982694E|nr:nuclear transport factor 2 family protein [Iodobacter sp. CM08]MDW5416645.1 nuclear transport factor 2 family protein [Iodobacter sp. CM08]